MSEESERREAIVCYLLSKRQGNKMIADLLGKSVEEVERLAEVGEKALREERERRERN